jgi:two-component sensor histidine kinase
MFFKVNILKSFIILSIVLVPLFGASIEINKTQQNILKECEIYVDAKNRNFEQIKAKNNFTKIDKEHLNLGFTKNKIAWIRFTLQNNSKQEILKILEVKNPLLEKVSLYYADKVDIKGMLYVDAMQTNIQPAFEIILAPKSLQTYYLKIENRTTSLRFGLFLKDKNVFLSEELHQQLQIFLFLGILLSLFAYNLLLSFYTKEKSYLLYSLYLFALLFQQLTYLGITPLIFSKTFVTLDTLIVVLKVNIMYIFAALFAQSFLQTQKYKKIDTIYKWIVKLAILEIPLFGTPWFYYPEIGIVTGLFFVLFNIVAGVYIYLDGYKQARLFVIGWSVLIFGFVAMILDGLGLISIMHKIPNIIMYLTALEAFILSLAFTDRYIILQKLKNKTDNMLLAEINDRQKTIEAEIQKQTKELSESLENKKTLLKELHHRTKNNLQLILSIIRLQTDHAQPIVKQKLKELQNRIIAISKTYQMLYPKNDLQHIVMQDYLDELCSDITDGFSHKEMKFQINAPKIVMPLREAVYVGLIVNEAVTNSIKYSNSAKLFIEIKMQEADGKFFLSIKDNGQGYDINNINKNTIGTALIKTLAEQQLDGTLTIENQEGVCYMIEYRL